MHAIFDIPHKGKEWQQIISYLLGQKKGRCLDIPSGNLWLTKILLEHGFDCVADDICYDKPTDTLDSYNIEFHASNLDKGLPNYASESFDYVMCFQGLEHIANPYVAIQEFYRVLRNGGKLFVTLPNCASLPSRLRFFQSGEFSVFPHIMDYNSVPRHLHINPLFPSQFFYVASEIGFELIEVRPFKQLKKSRLLLTSPLVPLILMFQHWRYRSHDSSPIKRLLQSRMLLMRQELFIGFQKIPLSYGKTQIGDRGYYPSLGIV